MFAKAAGAVWRLFFASDRQGRGSHGGRAHQRDRQDSAGPHGQRRTPLPGSYARAVIATRIRKRKSRRGDPAAFSCVPPTTFGRGAMRSPDDVLPYDETGDTSGGFEAMDARSL